MKLLAFKSCKSISRRFNLTDAQNCGIEYIKNVEPLNQSMDISQKDAFPSPCFRLQNLKDDAEPIKYSIPVSLEPELNHDSLHRWITPTRYQFQTEIFQPNYN